MKEIVFFLEELSAEAMLHELLPRILPGDIHPKFVVFEGKRDLEKHLLKRLRGYRNPHARYLVLRDKDAADCRQVKASLLKICRDAGRPAARVRIACHELESWYLADFAAVEKGLNVAGLVRLHRKQKYRDPDAIANAAEELRRLVPSYEKIGGSRAIGPHLDPDNRRSSSFKHFIAAIHSLVAELMHDDMIRNGA